MACQICNHGGRVRINRPNVHPPKRSGTLGTTSLPAGRDAVLSVPLLFFATRERIAGGLTHSLCRCAASAPTTRTSTPPKRSGTLGTTSLPARSGWKAATDTNRKRESPIDSRGLARHKSSLTNASACSLVRPSGRKASGPPWSRTGSSSSKEGKSVRFQNRPIGISSPHL
jgi:hypothetical protein